ncbi:hypothetical protein RJT34_00088 [Clitoria ternatea]|uniref:Uncharacterized protein n=1 Tax=Clitoria ternatea TaxID=43366 RepID=A0AAN9KEV8_CLITE
MLSCFCIFRNIAPSSWMAPLTLLLVFSSYQLVGFGFSSLFFTSLALFLSSTTLLLMWKQHKAVPADELVEENALKCSEEKGSQEMESSRIAFAPTPVHQKNETLIGEGKERLEELVAFGVGVDGDNNSAKSGNPVTEIGFRSRHPMISVDLSCGSKHHPILFNQQIKNVFPINSGWISENKMSTEWQEMLLSSSEDYEVDHTPECSDGSISDEDSLIEIALPSGHFVGHQREESKYNCSLQQKKRELSAHEALFNQQSLMEFLAEFNEEENLIEIDIAMGSIKYSRFEIEA